MTDIISPGSPQSQAPDPSKGAIPSVEPVVRAKPASPPPSATQVWKRRAGAFGRNPVPGD